MTYILSASKLMTAAEVLKQGKLLRNNAVFVAAVEAKVKQHFKGGDLHE